MGLTSVGYLALSLLSDIPAWTFLLPPIFNAIGGGPPMLFLSGFRLTVGASDHLVRT